MENTTLFTRARAAELSGVTVIAVHYLGHFGVIETAFTKGGQRRVTQKGVDTLKELKKRADAISGKDEE